MIDRRMTVPVPSTMRRKGRPDWLKMKNADAPAMRRETEEEWGKKKRL
jgi:hypothetical protein